MAISVYKNGHFEKISSCSEILERVSNYTMFYLKFDTHDSPGYGYGIHIIHIDYRKAVSYE